MLAPKRTGVLKFFAFIIDFLVGIIDALYLGITIFFDFGRQSDTYTREELNYLSNRWKKYFSITYWCPKRLYQRPNRPNRPEFDGSGNSMSNQNDGSDDFKPKRPFGRVRQSEASTFRCGGGG
ncbi:hypothetical protein IMG5_118080 [Ichthyophthirius multifiliis]|uniref:Uncharacterized protein n=1 Tax=Ichthyophthirius multifiliis TaxID=5932 RepID=G0QUN7_ICHMU|nr:hypothetical protein IMG5_118080 [Ichthyophthirius multifiliis]EGR31083.1 hypothetical protein IMG5_118080 [Ichthyophthirius multifiliis]|eukprot:XP_004034569.1 hypothetical protein IMG5_118080 [Ichthyophthirius multifiliis]